MYFDKAEAKRIEITGKTDWERKADRLIDPAAWEYHAAAKAYADDPTEENQVRWNRARARLVAAERACYGS